MRDAAALKSVVDHGVAKLGRLDIVGANAGVCALQTDEMPEDVADPLDTNLTGVWHT